MNPLNEQQKLRNMIRDIVRQQVLPITHFPLAMEILRPARIPIHSHMTPTGKT